MSEQASAAPSVQNESSQVEENQSIESEESGSLEASADVQDAQEVLEDPNASKKEKAEARKMLKSLKIKYNGKEYEEQLPFEIPDDEKSIDYMRKQLQMSKMAQSKSQEKAQMEKEVSEFIRQLQTNPRAVLEDPSLGINLQDLVSQYIEDQIEQSKKTPEQVEREKLEKELRRLQEEREKEKEDQRSRELERLQELEFQRYDTMISKSLEGSDLPKSPYVVKKMADYMLMGLQEGMDVTPEDVLPLVREEIQQEIKQMFGVMPEDVIEKIIGNDVLGKLRKKRVAQAKAPAPAKKVAVDTGAANNRAKEPTEPAKKVTIKDFFKI